MGRCEYLPVRYRRPAALSHPAPLAGPVLAIHGQPVRSSAPHPWRRTPSATCPRGRLRWRLITMPRRVKCLLLLLIAPLARQAQEGLAVVGKLGDGLLDVIHGQVDIALLEARHGAGVPA